MLNYRSIPSDLGNLLVNNRQMPYSASIEVYRESRRVRQADRVVEEGHYVFTVNVTVIHHPVDNELQLALDDLMSTHDLRWEHSRIVYANGAPVELKATYRRYVPIVGELGSYGE